MRDPYRDNFINNLDELTYNSPRRESYAPKMNSETSDLSGLLKQVASGGEGGLDFDRIVNMYTPQKEIPQDVFTKTLRMLEAAGQYNAAHPEQGTGPAFLAGSKAIQNLRDERQEAMKNAFEKLYGHAQTERTYKTEKEKDVRNYGFEKEKFGKTHGLHEKQLGLEMQKWNREMQSKDIEDQLKHAQIEKTLAEAKSSGQLDIKTMNQVEGALRDDYDKSVKNFNTVKDYYSQMKGFAKNSDSASDIGILYSYMHILDPASTVGTQDQANIKNAGGVPEWVRAEWNKTLQEGFMSKGMRAKILKAAESAYSSQKNSASQHKSFYETIAKDYGVNPTHVVHDTILPDENPYLSKSNDDILKRAAELGITEEEIMGQQ